MQPQWVIIVMLSKDRSHNNKGLLRKCGGGVRVGPAHMLATTYS